SKTLVAQKVELWMKALLSNIWLNWAEGIL
ncbi:hypothetical protein SCG7109_CB_00040, partial [Chlamydiales bacterium SCGC AG-110-M15]